MPPRNERRTREGQSTSTFGVERQVEPVPRSVKTTREQPVFGRRRRPYITEVRHNDSAPSLQVVGSIPATGEHAELIARTDFSILDLPRPFVTPPGIELPPVDKYGWLTGPGYSALLKARTPSLATRAALPDFKFHRLNEALSMSEFGIQLALKFNPYVVDMREQYGTYDPVDFWQANANGKRMRRSSLMTIDIIATYVQPPDFELRYHAISVKHATYRRTEKDKRREIKERILADKRNWTWEMLLSNAVLEQETNNYVFLWSLIRNTKVPRLYEPARRFADRLMAYSVQGSMHSVLERRARGLGIGLDDAYRLFASSISYGFLTLDHSKRLGRDRQIALRG